MGDDAPATTNQNSMMYEMISREMCGGAQETGDVHKARAHVDSEQTDKGRQYRSIAQTQTNQHTERRLVSLR